MITDVKAKGPESKKWIHLLFTIMNEKWRLMSGEDGGYIFWRKATARQDGARFFLSNKFAKLSKARRDH